MKVLVVYYSQTGNTEKIANAIYEEISTKYQVDIEKMKSISPEFTNDYDLLIIGAPCIDSDLAVPLKKFLSDLPESPSFKLAGFYTHATHMTDDEGQGGLFSEWAGRCLPTFEKACETKQIEFIGDFHCMGKANPGIEHFIHQEIITDEKEWETYLPDLRTRPNDNDIEDARKFAQDLISKIS